jgi:pentatricopeptide repeat protein
MLASPSGHDVVNMLRCYIGSQDLEGLRETLANLRIKGHFINGFTLNRALAACGASAVSLDLAEELVSSGICPDGLDSVGYNSLMKCNARAGRLGRCFQLRAEMLAKGIELSEITYGILLDACVGAKQLDHARKVFDDLCSSGLQLNVVHCTTFIKALVGAGRVDEASRVLQEMARSTGVKPDLIAYSTIVKAHAETGNVSSALRVLEEMIQAGVTPDEIIFNSVLSACSIFPLKSADVLRTFEALVGNGMRPTTTTLSIALKGLMLTDACELSLQLLAEAPAKFGIVLQPRLYMQVARACIKARLGTGLLHTFDAMLCSAKARGQTVDSSDVSILVRNCALGGELQIALELQRAAQKAGIALEPQAEKLLKSAAARKAKFEKRAC